MADETKDPGGNSNDDTKPKATSVPQPQPQQKSILPELGESDVRILEEHVTHAASKPAPPSQPEPQQGMPKPSEPPVSTVPPPPSAPAVPESVPEIRLPPAPAAPPPPTPTPPKATTPALVIPPPQIPQSDPIAEDVGLVLPARNPAPPPVPMPPPAPPSVPIPTPPPAPAPAAPPAMPPPMPQTAITPNRNVPAIGNDIAKILADVKLPERREPVISGEKTIAEAQKKFDTSIVGSAMHDPADKAAGAAPAANTVSQSGPKEAEKNPSSVAAVHTLKNDLQGVVQDKKISLVRAVSLEEDRRARKVAPVETPATQQRSKRTFAIIFTTLILLGLGVAALFGVFFVMNQSQAPLPTDTSSSILFAEQSVLLPLEGQSPGDLKRLLESGRAGSGGALGSITRIIPVIVAASTDDPVQNRAATFGEFMTAIGAHPPEELLRALGGDFFFGIHTADENAPLFVVPVTSHDHAFAAMLNWEEVLNADLAPVFTFVPTLASDANGLPVQRTYQDVVMRNYDVRALRDDAGDIQLYYSFPTQNILVIAESPYSFTEILSRLQAGRKL